MSAPEIFSVEQRLQVVVWAAADVGEMVNSLMNPQGALAQLDPTNSVPNRALMFWDGRWRRVRNALAPAGRRELARATELVAADRTGAAGLVLVMYGGSKPFSVSAPEECWITVAGSADGSTNLKLHVSEALTDRLFPFLSELAQRVPLLCGGAWGGTQVGVGPSWSDSRRWFVAQVGPTRINGPLWITVAGVTANERLTTLPSSLLDEVVARSNSDLGGVVWQLSRDPSGPSGPHLHQWLTALAEADLMPA